MINTRNGMLTCDNKMSELRLSERDNIPTPRTVLISNEKSLMIKCIQEIRWQISSCYEDTNRVHKVIGVSLIESEKSLVSVAQSFINKFNAALLIQEYIRLILIFVQ